MFLIENEIINNSINFKTYDLNNTKNKKIINYLDLFNEFKKGGIFLIDNLNISKNAIIDLCFRNNLKNIKLNEKLKDNEFQIVNDTSNFYLIKIKKDKKIYEFRDLEKVTGGIDLKKINNNKILAIKNLVDNLIDLGLFGLTLGNSARRLWMFKFRGAVEVRGVRYNSENINDDMLTYIQGTNNGGLNILNERFKGVICKNTLSIDCNSLYGFIAENYNLPFGNPVFMTLNEYKNQSVYKTAIFKVLIKKAKIKSGFVPCWGLKLKGERINKEYPSIFKDRICFLWEHELKTYKKYYDINYSVMQVLAFKVRGKLLNPFIDHFKEIKEKSENKTQVMIAKRVIPAFIGKFGSNQIRVNELVDKNGEVAEIYSNESRDFYLPLYTFITSMSQVYMIDFIQLFGIDNFIYTDTDSITAFSKATAWEIIPFDPHKFGYFKIESKNKKFIALQTKVYAKEDIDGEIKNVASGVKIKKEKSCERFFKGVEFVFQIFTFEGGSIIPKIENRVVKIKNERYNILKNERREK